MCYRYGHEDPGMAKSDAQKLAKWIPFAEAMVEFLEEAEDSGSIQAEQLPTTLYHAGVYFFTLALSAVQEDAPVDPEASIANYCIAAGAIRATVALDEQDRAAITKRLGLYTDFVKKLQKGRKLTQSELGIARELLAFFRHLSSAGGVEQYEAFVDPQIPPVPEPMPPALEACP